MTKAPGNESATDAMMSYRTVLVTGGAGFVGSNLAVWYQQQHPEARVIALDNLKRRGTETTLPWLRAAGVEFVHGDIRNPEDLRLPGRAIDLLLECSAEPSVLAGVGEAPDYLLNTNLLGTLHCLELARRTGADLIFFSTSRVYPVAALNRLAVVEQPTRFALADEQTVPGASARGIAESFPLEPGCAGISSQIRPRYGRFHPAHAVAHARLAATCRRRHSRRSSTGQLGRGLAAHRATERCLTHLLS